ncbi:MAG TPA: pitrilysin family protein, partial [Polyangia bacterium]|nr:pitrilysin family protein [Polyangia bacterium]
MSSLVSACGGPQGAGAPALAVTALPAAVDGRKTRLSFELGNGVKAILEENHVAPLVALQAWIGVGSAAEPAAHGGLAHLTERVVLGGAPPGEADVAPCKAWTSFDETVFETVVAAPHAGARLDALGAMLARATFDAAELERGRADALGEARRASASSASAASRALFAAAFEGHGYARPVLGVPASLEGLTGADVAAFHRRAYAGANVTIVAVGDFDARAFRERVATAFGSLPRSEGGAPPPPAPALAGPRAAVAVSESGEAALALGYRLSTPDAEELAAVDVFAAALAHDGAGRLPRALVLNRQLARAVRATVVEGREGGLLELELPLVAGRFEDAARVALAEVSRAALELGSAELEGSRAALEVDLSRAQETAAGYARKLGLFSTIAGDIGYQDRYLEGLRGLTAPRVREVAAALVRPSNLFFAAVAPAGGAVARAPEGLAARLRALAPGALPAPARDASQLAAVTSSGGVVRVVLPSGLRVLVLRDPTAPSVVAHATWSGGLRLEDARTNGVTGLLAATLPRGTRTRDPARLAADLAALGGHLSASAGRDELGVDLEFLARRWEDGLALLADCLRYPAFSEDEVERARLAALERVRDHEDDAELAATRLFAATLWPGHPYRLPLLGTAGSLSALSRRRLADHFQRHYGASNLTIALVGDLDVQRVVDYLRALFADASAPLVAASAAPPPAPRATDGPTEVFALAAREQAHVVVGYAGLPLGDPEGPAAEVLVEILGGRDGRLARELGDISLVHAAAWSGLDGGALVFDLASTLAGVEPAVVSLRAAVARAAASPFLPAEVERARALLVGAAARGLESRGAVAAALARDEALGTRRADADLASVTPDAVARVARRLLDPRFEIVAVVRPPAQPVASTPAARTPAKTRP